MNIAEPAGTTVQHTLVERVKIPIDISLGILLLSNRAMILNPEVPNANSAMLSLSLSVLFSGPLNSNAVLVFPAPCYLLHWIMIEMLQFWKR